MKSGTRSRFTYSSSVYFVMLFMGLVCAYNPIPLMVKIKGNEDVNASLAIVSILPNFDEYII